MKIFVSTFLLLSSVKSNFLEDSGIDFSYLSYDDKVKLGLIQPYHPVVQA